MDTGQYLMLRKHRRHVGKKPQFSSSCSLLSLPAGFLLPVLFIRPLYPTFSLCPAHLIRYLFHHNDTYHIQRLTTSYWFVLQFNSCIKLTSRPSSW